MKPILFAATSDKWKNDIADARSLDKYAVAQHSQVDRDHHLCCVQRQHAREGYVLVEVATNIFGYCVRDTHNDGDGVLFGGRRRPGTTKQEAIDWARDWHNQLPTHREVIEGFEGITPNSKGNF